MNEFHKLVSKKLAFVLFNLGTIIYLAASGALEWNWVSLLSYGGALAMMNGIAWFSSRNFPEWK
jgi:hypothetical protein